jgi:hypothetical protein
MYLWDTFAWGLAFGMLPFALVGAIGLGLGQRLEAAGHGRGGFKLAAGAATGVGLCALGLCALGIVINFVGPFVVAFSG